jgi:hypothetical protein
VPLFFFAMVVYRLQTEKPLHATAFLSSISNIPKSYF